MKKIIYKARELFNWFIKLSLRGKAIFIVFLLIGSYFAYTRFNSRSQQTQYQTAQVVRESIISTITESGNVTSSSQTNIGSPTNGVISEVYVKNGDVVYAGQNLFSVRSTATPQEQAAAYANFLSAQNVLNSAKARMNSLQSALFKANQAFVNDKGVQNPSEEQKRDPKYIEENADWLQAESDYNNQAGVIAAAAASYSNASLQYASTQDSVVTAPIDGTVANFASTVGSNVSASGTTYNNSNTSNNSSNTTSSPVLVLGNFSELSIKAPVSEVDIAKVKTRQKATVTLDAYPDRTFVGKVQSIDTIGTNSSGVITFNSYIALIAPPDFIHPGMSATAIVQLARHDDVLAVPTAAIQNGTNGSTVRVLSNGKITERSVVTGLVSDTDTEIISGLSEGETVITNILTPATSSSTGASPFSGLRGFGGGGIGGNVRVGGGGSGGNVRVTR